MVTFRSLLAAAIAALAALAACGGGAPDPTTATPLAVSPGCPDSGTTPYRYAGDIVPILDQACIPCHSPGGIGGFDESTYSKVLAQQSPMLDQVSSFAMPPTNGPVLTDAQRFALTQWLECGSPDD